MVDRIRSNQGWKKHLPQKPRRVQRGYYTDRKDNQHKTVVRIIWVIFIIFALQSIFHIKYFKVDKIFNLDSEISVEISSVSSEFLIE